MEKIFVILVSILAGILAAALPNPEDKKNNQFDYNIKDPGILDLNIKRTLVETPSSQLVGSANFQKNFVDKSKSYGGQLSYDHDPSDLKAGVSVQHNDKWGTNVQGEITKTLLKDRFSNIEGGLSYGQTFDTPFGNTEPKFEGFIRGRF